MKLFTCIFFLALSSTAQAQQRTASDAPNYPQDYFRNPLDIPIFLAGNFGECRPGHFHSGVDIKTQGKENLPVRAAAEGYISRIKMEKGGFGHGLYITHPSGYTTLYAHLNEFAPEIQKYVKKEQYAKKRWDVDLAFTPDQFPMKKGQLIAYSGNTGASTAPHLHFEIRNTKTEHPLNPQLFGLPIIDNIAPVPTEVVFYNGIYDGEGLFVSLVKNGNTYHPAKTSNAHFEIRHDTVDVYNGTVGIGINVDDFMNGSDNTLAFYTAKVYLDDSLQAQVTLDDIGYDVTRYVNAYADFKTKKQRHKWVQCLFQLPGNQLDGIYSNLNNSKGRLCLKEDGKAHKLTLMLSDDKANNTRVEMFVSPKLREDAAIPAAGSVLFQPNKVNDFSNPNVSFSLDAKQLYDGINFLFQATPGTTGYSYKYQLHYPYIPLHHYFDLQIKPNKTIPIALRSKVVMMYSDDKDEDGRAAAFGENGWYKAKVRNFGTYWLDIDTTAPVIHSMQKNGANLAKAKQIAIEVKDEATSVKSFSGYIDGKWVCFEQYGNTCFYKFDEYCPKGKHKLLFKAEDENWNEVVYNLNFTR